MKTPQIFYSCCTYLSYLIAEKYYGNKHYVWCTSHFDAKSEFARKNYVPPTSSPFEIYKNLKEAVKRLDSHYDKITQNRLGLQKGADVHLAKNNISQAQHEEIQTIVKAAPLEYFRPLILVFTYEAIKDTLKEVPLEKKASMFSEEFIVESLPRDHFDVLVLEDR